MYNVLFFFSSRKVLTHLSLASLLWDIGKQQNAASHLGLFCLLGGISSKNDMRIKNHYYPKNESGLTQLIMMGKSIRQIWVKMGEEVPDGQMRISQDSSLEVWAAWLHGVIASVRQPRKKLTEKKKYVVKTAMQRGLSMGFTHHSSQLLGMAANVLKALQFLK